MTVLTNLLEDSGDDQTGLLEQAYRQWLAQNGVWEQHVDGLTVRLEKRPPRSASLHMTGRDEVQLKDAAAEIVQHLKSFDSLHGMPGFDLITDREASIHIDVI